MNDQTLLELVRRVDPLAAGPSEPPPALLQRVLSSPRTEQKRGPAQGWQVRFAVGAAVLALSGVIAALAIAGTGWLTGAPASPAVVTDFQNYTPQLGFHPDPGKAVLVAEDGQVKLYATTDREGTYCLDVVAPWKPATVLDGGTCVPKPIAAGPFIAGPVGAGPVTEQGMTVVVAGRIDDPRARSVEFRGPDGKPVTRPVESSGFFLAALTTSAPCANGDWSSTFTALDSDGSAVAQTPVLSLEKAREKNSPVRGPVHDCLLLFLQK